MDIPHLISIVGAGPGDPELLTVKAQKRLENAEVVLYDALMGDKILDLVNSKCIKKYVGKRNKDGQDQSIRQEDIYNEIVFWAKQNKKIVRLKAGDPMIFGRGAEEIRFCKENNLNYEVIPGITAGIAGASQFSVPLTERGKNNMVLFYTGQNKNGGFSDIDSVAKILHTGSPALIYMGLNNLPEMAKQLQNLGIDSSVSVQVQSRISQSNQKNYSTTLGDVEGFLFQNQPETPSLVIIGKNAVEI